MSNSLVKKITSLWAIKEEFRLKVFFLASTFLFMSACVAIWRPLKNSIFAKIVGAEFMPNAKLWGLCVVIPMVLIYSKLVDYLRRHHLLYFFNIFHGLVGIVFYFLLSNPVYGLANTDASPGRLVGWAFYFFMESFNAFLSTSFWAFANSVNKPKDAKNFFGFFVCGSKIGSILGAGSLYLAITFLPNYTPQVLLPTWLLLGSFLLFLAALCVYLLMKKVPGYYMHGYEAVYQLEKQKKKEEKKKKTKESVLQFLKNAFEGLLLIIKNPYVLGIFSLVIFYEVIVVIFDFRFLLAADAASKTASGLALSYALYYILMNVIGLFFVVFGTTPILRILGIRTTLFVFPIVIVGMLLVTLFFPYTSVFFWVLVLLRALNYAFNHPTKEVLYIPTPKNIKFKAKAWIDGFGSRISKSGGSIFNLAVKGGASQSLVIFTSILFSLGLATAWIVVVYFLGKVLQNAISNKKVIGKEEA